MSRGDQLLGAVGMVFPSSMITETAYMRIPIIFWPLYGFCSFCPRIVECWYRRSKCMCATYLSDTQSVQGAFQIHHHPMLHLMVLKWYVCNFCLLLQAECWSLVHGKQKTRIIVQHKLSLSIEYSMPPGKVFSLHGVLAKIVFPVMNKRHIFHPGSRKLINKENRKIKTLIY